MIVAMFPTLVSANTPYVTLKQVALKQSASTKAKTLVIIPKGKTIIHLSDKGSWSNVQYGKQKGFVAKRDVKKQLPVSQTVVPAPSYSYTQYASYKGGSIISFYGKSYKIDPALLPFFKKNAGSLRTIFGLPTFNGNTLVGYKELMFDLRGTKPISIMIDAASASRIQAFVVPINKYPNVPVTVTATAPVRQLATSGSRPHEPRFQGDSELRLNGPFQQVDLTGRVILTGKASINRLVLRMGDFYPSAHSYLADVHIDGTISNLESMYRDAQITLGKTTVVRNIKAIDDSQLVDGQFGLIQGEKLQSNILKGRRMTATEQQISTWTDTLATRKVDDSILMEWLQQLGLRHVFLEFLPSYRLALETNATATNTRVQMGTVEAWQQLILDVNASLSTTVYDRPYVLVEGQDAVIRHDRPLRDLKTERTDTFQKELIGLIGPTGQLEQIAFKRTYTNAKFHQYGIPDFQENFSIAKSYQAPGTYRHVSILNGRRHVIGFDVAPIDGRLGVVKVNGQNVNDFQKTPPKVEIKLAGAYLFVRSTDSAWLGNAQQFKSGPYNEPTQLAVGNLSQAGDWNKGAYLAAGSYGLAKGKSIRIQAYGYRDVVMRIP